jgi:tRNA pseudouridine55 synthase
MNKQKKREIMDGIILVDKPKAITSRDVVDAIMKKFDTKKVGHTGTLDPFATGLMMITLGKGTKLGPFIENLFKVYTATIQLGTKTDTGDLMGEVVATSDVIEMYDQFILDTLESFIGKQMQIPPMYSALKKDGKPLYAYAREGITVERFPRPIEIFEMKLGSLTKNTITFNVKCSKGTYVRTLGEAIAEKLGMVGHLTMLRRLAIGQYKVSGAKTIDDVSKADVIAPLAALSFMPQRVVGDGYVKAIKDGKPQSLPDSLSPVVLISAQKELLAIYEKRDDGLFYSVRGLF